MPGWQPHACHKPKITLNCHLQGESSSSDTDTHANWLLLCGIGVIDMLESISHPFPTLMNPHPTSYPILATHTECKRLKTKVDESKLTISLSSMTTP